MNTEIEIKAWIDNPLVLEKALVQLPAQYMRRYEKRDVYFHLMDGNVLKQSVRLRVEGSKATATLKEKRFLKNLEISHEHEFVVSHPENFIHFLKCSGYQEFIQKYKTGTAWQHGDYLLELSEVKELGTFIEIEFLTSGRASSKTIQQTDVEIRKILRRLNIPDSKIEERSYTSMLTEKIRRDTAST